jgi:hypothetical protein
LQQLELEQQTLGQRQLLELVPVLEQQHILVLN